MADPYDILGVKRGASLDEIKSAYRRACKTRHPDMGGSHEAMVELNTAYAFILAELKSGFQQKEKEEPKAQADENAWHDVGEGTARRGPRDTYWRDLYRDIDDELENLRRTADQYDEQLRRMREAAWVTGQHAAWAKLTFDDLLRFFRTIARSGLKGLSLLIAALLGVGSILLELNLISGFIVLGSGLGIIASMALKSDKGGIMSAGLLLFGLMTLWLPPVREALFALPVATISVLICLALILKFAQAGGTVGLLTGGVLALYMIGVIVQTSAPHPHFVATAPPVASQVSSASQRPGESDATMQTVSPPRASPNLAPTAAESNPTPTRVADASSASPPEILTLSASDGAILKFASGVEYRLKVRTGFATSLHATQGKFALATADCVTQVDLPPRNGTGPWQQIDRNFHACGDDAIIDVSATP